MKSYKNLVFYNVKSIIFPFFPFFLISWKIFLMQTRVDRAATQSQPGVTWTMLVKPSRWRRAVHVAPGWLWVAALSNLVCIKKIFQEIRKNGKNGKIIDFTL